MFRGTVSRDGPNDKFKLQGRFEELVDGDCKTGAGDQLTGRCDNDSELGLPFSDETDKTGR